MIFFRNSKYIYAIVLICFLSNNLLAQENISVKKIAEAYLVQYLEKIPIGMETKFGFNQRSYFHEAKLISPISNIYPTEEFFFNNKIDSTISNYKFTYEWDVPVVLKDSLCCFLKAKKINGNIKIIGIGGNEIAKNINGVCAKNKNERVAFFKFPNLKKQYLIFYDDTINYKSSTCYPIGGNKITSKDKTCVIDILTNIKSNKN